MHCIIYYWCSRIILFESALVTFACLLMAPTIVRMPFVVAWLLRTPTAPSVICVLRLIGYRLSVTELCVHPRISTFRTPFQRRHSCKCGVLASSCVRRTTISYVALWHHTSTPCSHRRFIEGRALTRRGPNASKQREPGSR